MFRKSWYCEVTMLLVTLLTLMVSAGARYSHAQQSIGIIHDIFPLYGRVMAVNSITNRIYAFSVTDYQVEIVEIDGNTYNVISRIPFQPGDRNVGIEQMAIDSKSNKLYLRGSRATLWYEDFIYAYDLETKKMIVQVKLDAPVDLTDFSIDSESGRIYTAYRYNNNILTAVILDGTTLRTLNSMPLPFAQTSSSRVTSVLVNPATHKMYVTSSYPSLITVLNSQTLDILKTIELPNDYAPSFLPNTSPSNTVYGRAYSHSHAPNERIFKLDGLSDTVSLIELPDSSYELFTYNPSTNHLFITQRTYVDQKIVALDASSLGQLASFTLTGPGAYSVIPNLSTNRIFALYDERTEIKHIAVIQDGSSQPSLSDSDGDGLYDEWEEHGIDSDHNGTIDLDLKALGADPDRKDLFVELDYMWHFKPDYGAIEDVVQSFSRAPVDHNKAKPGIALHVLLDDELPDITKVQFDTAIRPTGQYDDFEDFKLGSNAAGREGVPCGTRDFDGHFGTLADRSSPNCDAILKAKKKVFRYGIFAISLHNSGASGQAETPGNDFIITLGTWDNYINSLISWGGLRHAQASTFMHEFGHTLGLEHGGYDRNINCKPNYLSVMSYLFQFPNLDVARPLDYSRQMLSALEEEHLDENVGIGGPAGRNMLYGITGRLAGPRIASGSIDWNGNRNIDNIVTADINYINGINACSRPSPGQTLTGRNDWETIQYEIGEDGDFRDGFHDSTQGVIELIEEEVIEGAKNSDNDSDGIANYYDNCPLTLNSRQEDINKDMIGDACQGKIYIPFLLR